MNKVINLTEVKNVPNEDMIELIENVLDLAKAGDLRGLGIIFVDRENRIWTKARNVDAKHLLVAGCEYLKHDICASDD